MLSLKYLLHFFFFGFLFSSLDYTEHILDLQRTHFTPFGFTLFQ